MLAHSLRGRSATGARGAPREARPSGSFAGLQVAGLRIRFPNLASRTPAPLPWRRPRFELLLLILVAAAALSIVQTAGNQDATRMCLTRALAHGHLTIDDCIGDSGDRSLYGGHLYSDKAPGMSVLAIPVAEAVRLRTPDRWNFGGDPRLWVVRVLTSGLAFVLAAFLVGRVSEGLARGWGGLSLVTFSLGTLMVTFAASNFSHVPTAALAFGAFVLAWSRRPFLGGLVAGLALLVEYEAAAVVVLLGAYVALLGLRPLVRFAAGVIPGAVLLGAYAWLAFGAPWHNPLSYSDNEYQEAHASGILGITAPTTHAVRLVLVGDRGLLVNSPVLAVAAAGLWLLWRRRLRVEAALCAAITTVFLVAEFGYFDPYGGDSPGARYLVPALPFLCVGLAPAFARARLLTTVLAAWSVIAATTVALTWQIAANWAPYRQGAWGELVRAAHEGRSSWLVQWLENNVLVRAGASRLQAATAVGVVALAAFATAAWVGWRESARSEGLASRAIGASALRWLPGRRS